MVINFRTKHRKTSVDDWLAQANPAERREYDAFGPWIGEVFSEEDLPKRFRELYGPWSKADLVLKVPIDVERRNARPGQDLYRQLLVIKEDEVRLMVLENGEIEDRSVPISAIKALMSSYVLLLGDFELLLEDGSTLAFHYNTVSFHLINQAMDLLRKRLDSEIQAEVPQAVPVSDYYFQNLIRNHQSRRPGIKPVYCEEPGLRGVDEDGRRRRGQGLLILDTGTELLFVDRKGARYRGSYGSRCLVVPRLSWRGFHSSGTVLTLLLPGHSLEYRIFGNPEPLVAFLSQIPIN